MTETLSKKSKKALLTIARSAIESKLSGQPAEFPETLLAIDELEREGGAFVTIHLNGRLRGCIGLIESQMPLKETVYEMAYHAAFHDPRFPALTVNELPEIDLEISVLTKPKTIESPQQIRLGQDGIIFVKDNCRALFLPQVAPEQGWNLNATLSALSQKAGLSPSAWKMPDSHFEVFQAEYFDEKNLNG